VEQLITKFGGAQSTAGNLGQLSNKINSIAQGGPLWSLAAQISLSFVDISAVLDTVSTALAGVPCVPVP
jgi:hypothetical protein